MAIKNRLKWTKGQLVIAEMIFGFRKGMNLKLTHFLVNQEKNLQSFITNNLWPAPKILY